MAVNQKVIIIGMVHRYEYPDAPNEAKHLNGSDPNHFSSECFGGGETCDNPYLIGSEESYRIARAEFHKDGGCIIDNKLDGASTVFEKADHRQLFEVAA